MSEAWPADVNQSALLSGYNGQPDDNVYRFKPDTGPSVDLSRTITAGEQIQFSQLVSQAEYVSLKNWYKDSLKNGILSFTRLHPTEQVTATFVFMKDGFKIGEVMPSDYIMNYIMYRLA